MPESAPVKQDDSAQIQKTPEVVETSAVNPSETFLNVVATLFLDIFRVFGVCVLGISDKSRDFVTAIEMAERYFRWGQDQNELQDFLTALHYCKQAADEDAKRGELLVRKYKVVFASYIAVIKNSVAEFRENFFSSIEQYNIIISNLYSSYKNFSLAMKEAENLYRNDNPLAAMEKEQQADNLRKILCKSQHERVQYRNNDQFSTLFEAVSEMIENFHTELNRNIVFFGELTHVSAHHKESLTAGLQEEIENLKEGLKEFSPYQLRKRYSILEKDKEEAFEKPQIIFEIDQNNQQISLINNEIQEEEDQRRRELKEKMDGR